MPVFLTGMMGSGKTTVGQQLALASGAVFIDLDARIETVFGFRIAQCFADYGEAYFRRCERAALCALLQEPAFCRRDAIVATGGGAVVDPDNRDTMAVAGTIVYLDVDAAELTRRLEQDATGQDLRPLIRDTHGQPAQRLRALLAERREAYLDRSIRIDANASPDVVASRVASALPSTAKRIHEVT